MTRTVGTAGRTISFSAMIVIASLAGLFAFGDPTFTSLAIGGIATVLVALAAGLTPGAGAARHRGGARSRPPRHSHRRRVLRPAGPPGATPPDHRRGRRGRHPAGGRRCRSWRATTANGDPRTLPTSFESRAVERPARRRASPAPRRTRSRSWPGSRPATPASPPTPNRSGSCPGSPPSTIRAGPDRQRVRDRRHPHRHLAGRHRPAAGPRPARQPAAYQHLRHRNGRVPDRLRSTRSQTGCPYALLLIGAGHLRRCCS